MRSRVALIWTFIVGMLAVPAFGLLPSRASETHAQPTHIPSDRTRAAFATGAPLVETPAYKVHASRREAPGMAEIHTLDTDIIYVLEGTATVVTGGRALASREIGPNEIRGTSIEDGASRRLAKGDVFIVPNGVPHWFKEVEAPFLYYVVKTTARSTTGGAE